MHVKWLTYGIPNPYVGHHFAVSERLRLHRWGQFTSDRDILVLPDVLIEGYGCDNPTVLRPIFDAVWNAAGWERCFDYDEKGIWRARA